MCDNAAVGEEVKAIPKRWWWTKRLGVALGLVLIGMIAARTWWGHHADSVLQAELDKIAARGEPIRWADLAPEPVPEGRNAAGVYEEAIEACPLLSPPPQLKLEKLTFRPHEPLPMVSQETRRSPRMTDLLSMLSDLLAYPDFRRRHAIDVREMLDVSGESLRLCRQARGLEHCDWKVDHIAPARDARMPPLIRLRSLAKILCLAAVAAHEAGDDAAAVGYVRDAVALSRCVGGGSSLIAHLARLDVDALACSTVERIAPDLAAGDEPTAARREQVLALIAELGDGTEVGGSLLRAFLAERSMGYDTCERLRRLEFHQLGLSKPAKVTMGGRLTFWFVWGPVWKLDEARALRHMTAYVEAAKETTYPAAKREHPPEHRFPESRVRGATRILSSLFSPRLDRVSLRHFRVVATRRMTAVALAIRLYQLDRAGRRPEKLADLAPTYLPAVPTDPFAEDGRALAYLPDAERPLLYSVHDDGNDEGGSFARGETGAVDPEVSVDLVFFLNGNRPIGESDWQELSEREETRTRPAASPATRTSTRASARPPASPRSPRP